MRTRLSLQANFLCVVSCRQHQRLLPALLLLSPGRHPGSHLARLPHCFCQVWQAEEQSRKSAPEILLLLTLAPITPAFTCCNAKRSCPISIYLWSYSTLGCYYYYITTIHLFMLIVAILIWCFCHLSCTVVVLPWLNGLSGATDRTGVLWLISADLPFCYVFIPVAFFFLNHLHLTWVMVP